MATVTCGWNHLDFVRPYHRQHKASCPCPAATRLPEAILTNVEVGIEFNERIHALLSL
jgi:hypothetical protein